MSVAETPAPDHCPACGSRISGTTCATCALADLAGLSPHVPEALADAGVQFGRYELKQRLARGGMGVVYEAEDRKLKRTVALKMIRGSAFAEEGEMARFTIEAEAAAGLDHEHIVPVYEVGQLDGQPFFTMKLIRGCTLADLLREGPMPPRAAAELLSRVARAVHHAHQRGVLHRDLKPGNILIDEQGKPWLTDFGLAKLASAESGLTLSSDHLGTPHYMSPEAASGQVRNVSTASDVWALGVLLWEMVTGRLPFRGSNPMEVLRLITEAEPVRDTQTRTDSDLLTLARRCMEKQAARRPGSAEFVAEELDRWLRGEPLLVRKVSPSERLLKWARRRPAYVALAALFVFSLFTGLYLWHRAEEAVVDLSATNAMLAHSLRISSATRLAGDSRQMAEENPARALLLAAEAAETVDERGEVLPGAFSALCDVLRLVGGLDATPGGQRSQYLERWLSPDPQAHRITSVSPDGRWLVTMNHVGNADESNDHSAIAALFDLHDTHHTAPLRRWTIYPYTGTAQMASVPAGVWLDERHFAVLNPDGEMKVLALNPADLTTGRTETAPPAVVWSSRIERPWTDGGIYDCWAMRLPSGEFYFFAEWANEEKLAMIWQPFSLAGPGKEQRILRDRPHRNFAGRVSPDGRWWLCCRDERGYDFWLHDLHQPAAVPKVLSVPEVKCFNYRFSGDSSLVALAGHAGEIIFFRTATGEAVRRVPMHTGGNLTMTFSPDDSLLALSGNSGEVTLIDLRESGPGRRIPLRLAGGECWSLAFSPDGSRLAAGLDRREVLTWSLRDLSDIPPPVSYRGSPTAVSRVSFSPDGRTLLSVGLKGTVRRWEAGGGSSGANPRVLQPDQRRLAIRTAQVALSPDQEWVAAATTSLIGSKDYSGFASLSRVDGQRSAVLCTHAGRAQSVAFSRDGRWLASAGADRRVNVWDLPALTDAVQNGQPVPEPRHVFLIENVRTISDWRLAFHPAGMLYMADCDGYITAWDLNDPQPDTTRKDERVHSIGYLLPDLAVSPDGRTLAVARHGWDHDKQAPAQFGNMVLLFDVTEPWPLKLRAMLPAFFNDRTSLAFSPDNRWLAAGAAGNEPTVWDLQAPDIAASRISAPVTASFAIAVGFSPDGSRLAIATGDSSIHLWDWRSRAPLRSCRTELPALTLAWTQSGHLVTGSTAGGVSVWDMDPARLRSLARRTAGRGLESAERTQFVNGR